MRIGTHLLMAMKGNIVQPLSIGHLLEALQSPRVNLQLRKKRQRRQLPKCQVLLRKLPNAKRSGRNADASKMRKLLSRKVQTNGINQRAMSPPSAVPENLLLDIISPHQRTHLMNMSM